LILIRSKLDEIIFERKLKHIMITNYIHWNPNPELVNVFGLSIRYYGLLFVGGLLIALYFLKLMFRRENLPVENLDRLTVYGMIGLLVGARLGHCLFYEPAYFLAHPIEMILPVSFPPEGGMKFIGFHGLASHGGALGLLIAIYFYSVKTKHAMIDILDLMAVLAGISAGFIRLANFMNGEIIGMPSTLPWAIVFENVDMQPRHPAQLYEAISYFIITGVMSVLYLRMRDKLQNGFFFGLVLVLIFIARFLIEFVKEDQVGFEASMTFNMGQLLSIPYILVGIGFMIYGLRKTKAMRLN
jgi:prolipoprotein diacylglyceryl transferase